MMNNRINILNLHEEINRKKERRILHFQRVLQTCHRKIKNASKQEHTRVYFDVPEFVLGLPVFNLSECITYLFTKLKENGFFVRFIPPKILYISWDYEEMNGLQNSQSSHNSTPSIEQNPDQLIMKPMLNYTPPAKQISLSSTPTYSSTPHRTQTQHQQHHQQRPNGKFVLDID